MSAEIPPVTPDPTQGDVDPSAVAAAQNLIADGAEQTAPPAAETNPSTPSVEAWKDDLGVAPMLAPSEVPTLGGPNVDTSAMQAAAADVDARTAGQVTVNKMPEGFVSPVGPPPAPDPERAAAEIQALPHLEMPAPKPEAPALPPVDDSRKNLTTIIDPNQFK